MDSVPTLDRPFHFDSVPDETPADLAEAMDFFLADADDGLTEADLCELARRHERRSARVTIPFFPVALTA